MKYALGRIPAICPEGDIHNGQDTGENSLLNTSSSGTLVIRRGGRQEVVRTFQQMKI